MRIKLYDSYSTLGQSLILLLFTPLNVLIWFTVIRTGISSPKLFFAIVVLSVSIAIFFLAMKTADVSIENGKFLIRTIFKRVQKSFDEFKKVGDFSPIGFYLEFEGNSKVYILFVPDDIVKQFTVSKSDKIITSIAKVIDREINS